MLRIHATLEIEQGLIVNKKLAWKIIREAVSCVPRWCPARSTLRVATEGVAQAVHRRRILLAVHLSRSPAQIALIHNRLAGSAPVLGPHGGHLSLLKVCWPFERRPHVEQPAVAYRVKRAEVVHALTALIGPQEHIVVER